MALELSVTDAVLQFTLVVTAALIVQLTLERTQIPAIVGLLLLGMAIGPGGAAVLPQEPVVGLLGSIGLLYIMFIAGLEIDLDVVQNHKREALFFGLLAFALSFVPAVAVGLLMGLEWTGAILVGAALSSHTLVSYPVVKRLGLVHRRPVVAAVGGTLLTDTVALVILAIVIQKPGAGSDGALGWAGPLALLAGLAALSLIIVPRIARYVLHDSPATAAERSLFLLSILLLLSLAADAIGTEKILGAFLAGICLNRLVAQRKELSENIQFVGRLLFVPFFFVDTGMRLELAVFVDRLDTWAMAGFLLGVVLFGKSVAAWIATRAFGYGAAAQATITGLTVPQAAATLAIVVIGRELDLIGAELVDAVIIVIFLTCLIGPILTRLAGQRLAARDD